MGDDITPLLKINTLKRRRAERDLHQHAAIVRAIETQIQTLQAKGEAARSSVVAQAKDGPSDASFVIANFQALERWEAAQDQRVIGLKAHYTSLQPELARLKDILKVLIVREDTLKTMALEAAKERRQEYDQKTAQVTQDLWVTKMRQAER